MKLQPIERITDAIENYFIEKAEPAKILNAYYNKTQSKSNWKKQATTLSKKEIKDFKMAIITATDPINPRRGSLMRFYQNYMTDLHLGSCIDNRILPVQCATFKLVNKDNNEDNEAHKLLEKPWFIDLVKKVCTTTFEGTKLLELFDLNERGELIQVTEIPMSNFLPSTGLIINEEWDTNGVSYREGIYKDYYVQIGGDNELGMFVELAVIVLAKKLGLGSWISYIEKLGIPPVFVTTDRMDTSRLDELFDMMSEFKSNFFTILQGNEKIEIPNTGSTDAYNSFKSLFSDVCNTELSKRILGGTGVMDEKSFVGAAEVHERMLSLRNKVDKLLFKFYFNEEIKPRLVKLSPVYAPLENLYFDFDDTESLTLKDLIQAVKDLSGDYEFDVEELARLTGLPITKLKNITASQSQNKTQPSQKKKPNASLNRQFTFAPYAKSEWYIYAATWDIHTEQMAKDIFSGKLKPEDLHKDYVLNTYSRLIAEAETKFGDKFFGQYNEIGQKIRNNVFDFSAHKAYNLMNKFNEFKHLNEQEYIAECKRIANIHNGKWLNTEVQQAAKAASSAYDWQKIVDDIDIFPNIKYRTMEDDRVRDSHAMLDGIIRPVNDSFWSVHFPPNGWWCRCDYDQTDEPATTGPLPKIKIDPVFANNPGQTGAIFSKDHNYFQVKQETKSLINENLERIKKDAPFHNEVDYKNVKRSHFADQRELTDNIKTAHILSSVFPNLKVKIQPHINANKEKNPEYELDGLLADAKRVEGYKGISTGFGSAINDQNCKYVIIDFNKHFDQTKELDLLKVASKIKNRRINFEENQIEGCYLVFGSKSVFINRSIFDKKLSDNELRDKISKLIKGLTP